MSGEKQTKLGISVYQARHSAKALRRLIREFGESLTLGSAFTKITNALPEKERIPVERAKAEKKSSKKQARKSARKSAKRHTRASNGSSASATASA